MLKTKERKKQTYSGLKKVRLYKKKQKEKSKIQQNRMPAIQE